MPYTETEADFRRVAPTHLANAFKLLERPLSDLCACTHCETHVLGAMYLAGYAVECILKAYLIRKLGKTYWDDAVSELHQQGINVKGGRGHSLQTLLNASELHLLMPPGIAAHYGTCNTWAPDWRYTSLAQAHVVGTQFAQAAERVYAWIEGQL